MSHRVDVGMISDQEITIGERVRNIHEIKTIIVNNTGQIVAAYLKPTEKNSGKITTEKAKIIDDVVEEICSTTAIFGLEFKKKLVTTKGGVQINIKNVEEFTAFYKELLDNIGERLSYFIKHGNIGI